MREHQEDDAQRLAAELLARIAGGDSSSLGRLYDHFADLLLGIIMTVLRDRGESEDVLQEVFLTLWKRADRYDPQLGKPVTWMITVARNRAFDRARMLGRRAGARERGEEGLKVRMVEQLSRQWSPAIAEDEVGILDSALAELPDDQREAISLAYLRGLTQQEISRSLDTPLGTVKARIRRGLLKLRDLLSQRRFPDFD